MNFRNKLGGCEADDFLDDQDVPSHVVTASAHLQVCGDNELQKID